MMQINGGKWYIAVFAAVTGFAAGAATKLDGGYAEAAFGAMGEAEGTALLGLALMDILLNTAPLCWCSIIKGKAGRAMSVMAIWFKAVLMGLFCRELAMDISGLRILLIMLTVLGGGCICASFTMDGEHRGAGGRRMAVWLFGAAAEGIMIPSVTRTWMLLFK